MSKKFYTVDHARCPGQNVVIRLPTRDLFAAANTGVGSGGYAGDLTPPTIYVGDIDMYIPLEKPNT